MLYKITLFGYRFLTKCLVMLRHELAILLFVLSFLQTFEIYNFCLSLLGQTT